MLTWSELPSLSLRYPHLLHGSGVLNLKTHTTCSGGWEVLDFGDVVVHVMSEEMRSYYDMESFYGAAEEVGCI